VELAYWQMTNRKALANALGWLSMTLSLAFWLLLCFGGAKGHFAREHFMQGMKMLFYVWEPIWVLGFLLAMTAAIIGSRRWAFATLLPAASFLVSVVVLASVPF
jgi:hypothetical protein